VRTTLSKGYVQFIQRKGSSRPLCEEQVRLESFDLWTWLVVLCLKERLRVRPHRKLAAATACPSRQIAAVCDLVTPDRARQLKAVQC